MQLRVTTWRQIFLLTGLITALAVAVPVITILLFLWHLPLAVLARIVAIAALIPFFIAFPISLAGLYLLKVLTRTVDTLDQIVKFDPLTGLLTRHSFLNSVEAARSNHGVMMLVDIDHFKSVNDNYGHEQGDHVLRDTARIVLQVAGPAALAGRMGGEEFAIYLAKATPQQASLLATGLGAGLRSHRHVVDGKELVVTASIGIAQDNPSAALRATLQRADICLYEAKRGGRDRFVMDAEAPELLTTALAS